VLGIASMLLPITGLVIRRARARSTQRVIDPARP
jgi:hypothetical protein